MVSRALLTSRRDALRAAFGVGLAASGLASCEARGDLNADRKGRGIADGAGVWKAGSHEGPTEFGILVPGPMHTSAAQFESDLETLANLGMSWVRLPIVADTVVRAWGFTAGSVQLDEGVLDRVRSGAAMARKRGLKVCLVVADIYDVPQADEAEFLRNMRQYWGGLAGHLSAQVDVWQIFNEPDGAHFRTGRDVPALRRSAYLQELARALAAAHEEIAGIDPDVSITTNLYGYPLGDAMERRWVESLDAIAPHLDLITVDAYPELSEPEARELPRRLGRLQERYGKEVAVGEIGLQTCSHCVTEEEQARAYSMYLDILQDSDVAVIFFYTLRDDGSGTGEGTFGIERADGSEKPSFEVIQEDLAS